MNYGELKAHIRDLGFAEDEEIVDFNDVVPNSINRAITEINLTVAPIIGTYLIEQDGTDDSILYYDIEELTKEDGKVKFLEFADIPVMVGTNVYKKFNDFEIEADKILVMDGSIAGNFKVMYKKAHEPFSKDSLDTADIELPLKVHHLIPLLASYYIWLEDERAKAVDYYNMYDKAVSEMLMKQQKPRARILSGGI